jgi:glutamate-1-semialdehyde 2,1-aminomutase
LNQCGKAQIQACLAEGFYENLESKTTRFAKEVNNYAKEKGFAFKIFHIGSIFWMAFTERDEIHRSDEIAPESMNLFKDFHHLLLECGIYIGPSGFEVGFVSRAHSDEDLRKGAEAMKEVLDKIFS